MSMNTILIGLGIVFILAVILFGYKDDYKRNPKKFIKTFVIVFALIISLYSMFWFSMSWVK